MKLFLAVGTQLAFDRLLRAVDDWADAHPDVEIFAQTGPTLENLRHIEGQNFVDPAVFEHKAAQADVIVAHAGTGTIFLALELGKPLLVMPRRASFGEHRNDHQIATLRKLQDIPGVNPAWDVDELRHHLDHLDELEKPDGSMSRHARPELLRALSDFINDAPLPRKRDRVRKLLGSLRI